MFSCTFSICKYSTERANAFLLLYLSTMINTTEGNNLGLKNVSKCRNTDLILFPIPYSTKFTEHVTAIWNSCVKQGSVLQIYFLVLICTQYFYKVAWVVFFMCYFEKWIYTNDTLNGHMIDEFYLGD